MDICDGAKSISNNKKGVLRTKGFKNSKMKPKLMTQGGVGWLRGYWDKAVSVNTCKGLHNSQWPYCGSRLSACRFSIPLPAPEGKK